MTRAWIDKLSDSQKRQSGFANAHYREQGVLAVLPLIAPGVANPQKVKAGLDFLQDYHHANGVTLGCEPGGIASKPAQDAQNAVLSSCSSPFRFYFLVDG